MEFNITKNKNFFLNLTNAWNNYFYKNAPMGKLLRKNSYKKTLLRNPIQILHLTPSIDKIKENKKLFSSGGGLGSVIYGSPLNLDKSPHNIYYLYKNFQLPKKFKKNKIKSLLIKIYPKTKLTRLSSWNVDYTLFGKIHCNVWKKIKNNSKINKKYTIPVEKSIELKIKNNIKDINLLVSYNFKELTNEKFNIIYKKIFSEFPELRFILYEVLAEYILLFQNNQRALFYLDKSEIYNNNHKKFIWDLCPTMLKKFKMKNFFIEKEEIIKYLKKRSIIKDFDEKYFTEFLKRRVSYYFLKICKKKIPRGESFNNYFNNYPYFIGQILYRKFFDKKLFEKYRSEYLYRIWNKKNLLVPIYSIVPKGEIGINPNLDKLKIKYKIYETKEEKGKIKILNKLDIKISPDNIPDGLCAVR